MPEMTTQLYPKGFNPLRLVSCSPDNTEILCALGAIDELVGISKHCDYPLGIQDEKPVISDFATADIEKIMALEPDIVFCSTYYQAEMVKQLVDSHLRVFVSQPSSLESIWKNIRLIAHLIGRPEKGEILIEDIQTKMPQQQSNGLKLFAEEWGDPIVLAAPWIHEMAARAGYTSVLQDQSSFTHTRDRIVTSEAVAETAPDIVILPWCGCHGRVPIEKVTSRAGWSSIPAVKNSKVFPVEDSFFVRPGPRLVQGYQQLCQLTAEATQAITV